MRGRTRDRRVYLGSHPVLFALLAATRRRPVVRLGRTLLVHDREAFVAGLTRIPLDRTADGTTGGAAGRLTGTDMLFDQHGAAHRRTRRTTADLLSSAAVAHLRPLWTDLMSHRLAPLARGGEVDLVPLAAELAGATAAALLGLSVDGRTLAAAARDAGATAARAHLPGIRRRAAHRAAAKAAGELTALVAPAGGPDTSLATMLAVAAINTTVAALPRAAAWCADDTLWDHAPQPLADELLRVTVPTPLLPRVAAAAGDLAAARPGLGRASGRREPSGCWKHSRPDPARHSGQAHGAPTPADSAGCAEQRRRASRPGRDGPGARCPVRPGDRLILIARHAVGAHTDGPDPLAPAPAAVAQLVFGTGPHACPGARLARAQLADFLAALAPHRPVVVRARVDRRAALPGWRSLVVRAGPGRADRASEDRAVRAGP